jgi:VanZ family protein
MGIIALLSSGLFGTDQTGRFILPVLTHLLPWAGPEALQGLHAALRKLAHLVEYGILAVLWLRALPPGRSAGMAALWAVGLSALYAVVDELHQGLAPDRSPSALDVAIDTVGAFLAVALVQGRGPVGTAGLRLVRRGAGLVAVASLTLAALEWSLGLSAWDLVLGGLGAAAGARGLRGLEVRWRESP